MKNKHDTLRIKTEETGRLDRFLAEKYPRWSRSRLQRLINGRFVLVDGHPVSANHKLKAKQVVTIDWPAQEPLLIVKESASLPFSILHEDDALLVINKPAGLVVHPSPGHRGGGSIVELLFPKFAKGSWPDGSRPGLVHRLDKDTSGILVLAKTIEAHAALSKQFAHRQVKKTYLAIAKGIMESDDGVLESNIGRHPGQRQRFAVVASGRWSSTKFKITEKFGDAACLVELYPLTGRTHQIRVHLSAYGHPILGDHVYGEVPGKFPFVHRQMLHAKKIELRHPDSSEILTFEAPLPADFHECLKILRLSA